mmetsp:Transcript_15752/g.47794  ORF Transcript_15752/g.47794 Transcript_15752/m.47794 type:complete len:200 (+) Transcript_15752:98-697(+)
MVRRSSRTRSRWRTRRRSGNRWTRPNGRGGPSSSCVSVWRAWASTVSKLSRRSLHTCGRTSTRSRIASCTPRPSREGGNGTRCPLLMLPQQPLGGRQLPRRLAWRPSPLMCGPGCVQIGLSSNPMQLGPQMRRQPSRLIRRQPPRVGRMHRRVLKLLNVRQARTGRLITGNLPKQLHNDWWWTRSLRRELSQPHSVQQP